ncbi:MAG TPA: hypothetical protein VIM71_02205 [Lacunisphaera sp.]
MKRKDYVIVALVPLVLLLIPITGQLTVDGWNWKWHGFVFAWAVFTFMTWFIRFLVTRPVANLPYKIAVGLAVVTGFLITWSTLAAQIIGEDNPGNALYLLTILGGFVGVGLSRFQSAALANVAFSMAGALLLIPVVAVLKWPADFSPGYAKVQLLSSLLAAIYVTSGLLFRRAAAKPAVA